MRVKFLKGGVEPKDYPYPYKPEVAIVGRSNAGKSSFINALTGQKIAKVSGTPGKTRILNFFELEEKVYMVDCPGYGFAKGNQDEVLGWRAMLETYFKERESLRGVLVIMDIRRDWAEEEEMLARWFDHHQTPWALILNKSDKLSNTDIIKRKRKMQLDVGEVPIFVASSSKKTGLDGVKNVMFKEWS